MGKNLDPAAAIPEEDASGCISLTETNADFMQDALRAFLLGCIALGRLFFWYAYLFRGGAPQVTNAQFRGAASPAS